MYILNTIDFFPEQYSRVKNDTLVFMFQNIFGVYTIFRQYFLFKSYTNIYFECTAGLCSDKIILL